jgi:hypothetical protein
MAICRGGNGFPAVRAKAGQGCTPKRAVQIIANPILKIFINVSF